MPAAAPAPAATRGVAVEPPTPATASSAPEVENSAASYTRLLGGAIEARHHASRPRFAQRGGDLPRLVARFPLQVIEGVAAEVQAAVERAVDAHVEPAFDALAEELDRDRVDEGARQHGDQREQQHQAQREPRPEHAAAQAARKAQELIADQEHQQRDQHAVADEQQVVAAREEVGVRRRRREQEQQDRAEPDQGDEQPAQAPPGEESVHGVKFQRFQPSRATIRAT